ncbi:MAG: SDR family oxidoreductase [candidate division NC10 bacterium]|nr:SDR family oxidoreductase [candidate division NC10 bacterium]
MARILIAGCGYIGTALAECLLAEGHVVWGLRRHPEGLPPGVRPLAADLTDPGTLRNLPSGLEFVFYTAAPDRLDDAAYRSIYVDGLLHVLDALQHQGQRPRRVFFTSSTVVYAQANGEWVDEASATEPTHFSGMHMLEAEDLARSGPFPATVIRLGGIYGPGRVGLIDRVRRGEAVCADGPPLFTNRIHRDDCVGALQHLMSFPQPEDLYLGVDHEPAEERVVLRWLAGRLGVPPPRVEKPGLGGVQRRRAGNKRCRNARLVASGYIFRYPTFRDGYGALLEGTPLRGDAH